MLVNGINSYYALEQEQQEELKVLLRRYTDMLNLPYTYERAEALWKILEGMCESSLLKKLQIKEDTVSKEYDRIKKIIGITNNSRNLRKIVKVLLASQTQYKDCEIKMAFNYRNLLAHEFLSRKLVYDHDNSKKVFRFLNCVLDLTIFKLLGLDETVYTKQKYTIINGKVF